MRGLEGFEKRALQQAAFFEEEGVPGCGAVLRAAVTLLEGEPAVRAAVENAWKDRDFQTHYERPLLLCAALHRELLVDPTHPMGAALLGRAPVDPSLLRRVLTPPSRVLDVMGGRSIQTNEVSRAVVWLLALPPAWRAEPVALVDLGCSAGLNLLGDRLELAWSAERGEPLVIARPAKVTLRIGLDRAPVDPADAEEALWLRACVWAGQAARQARLDAALAEALAARARGELELRVAEAEEMPRHVEEVAARAAPAPVLVYETVFTEYLLPETRARLEADMHAWLVRHAGRALWARFGAAPRGSPGPAEARLSFAADGQVRTLVVASSEFHPRVVTVDHAALAEVHAALR